MMTSPQHPDLDRLIAATANPSWVQNTYTTERTHTNLLAAALNSTKKAEARMLGVALWNIKSQRKITAEHVSEIKAIKEAKIVPQGQFSVVDLLIVMVVEGQPHELAVEVKVDGMPNGAQLASLAAGEYPAGVNRRMVLLAFGSAQACRIEPFEGVIPEVTRWNIADIIGLGDLVEAASPQPADARAWREELEREELRRRHAWSNLANPDDYGYRNRLMPAYRYRLAAEMLEGSGSVWQVSIQPFGVVLHCVSSHHELDSQGTTVTLYLEVADGKLRLKSGAWYDPANARAAAEPLLPKIVSTLEAHRFHVTRAKRSNGNSVTLLSIGPIPQDNSCTDFVAHLEAVFKAWTAIAW